MKDIVRVLRTAMLSHVPNSIFRGLLGSETLLRYNDLQRVVQSSASGSSAPTSVQRRLVERSTVIARVCVSLDPLASSLDPKGPVGLPRRCLPAHSAHCQGLLPTSFLSLAAPCAQRPEGHTPCHQLLTLPVVWAIVDAKVSTDLSIVCQLSLTTRTQADQPIR